MTSKDSDNKGVNHQELKEIPSFEILETPKHRLENDLKDVRVGRHLSKAYTNTKELYDDLGI